MTLLLLKLILAHLIGDFFLQPLKWVKDKEKKKLKSVWLYVHIAIHIALMFLIVWDVSYTPLILGIGLIHLIIDGLKLTFQRKKTKRLFFFIDQLLHLISIIGLTSILYSNTYNFSLALDGRILLWIISVIFLTTPTSIIMKTIFSKWNISKLTKGNESLKDAGKYIGVLERLMVFIFIITHHWEAVGFLITAKSVFRFGDLTASKERKLTEYILIGTLISFGIAIITSLLYLNLLHYV
ncbi:DUF3307 domain-containing protein [Winogradskyella psychrotolerans]|uniref:DUF3307 domain-containing protein n=1 Tax=Winogradskyella psychrotolerans TaxID=1344585 RepID=UPI001C07BC33|nr:DUF3307 domain-containing protein [Winogradskyella psychrotolerans]MBU2929717.1 DUF3307 domain-containing protein [Winogradskyella psychrotolerans]